MSKIVVLTAKSGFMGHMVIAQNYAHYLEKQGHTVALGDAFSLDGKGAVQKSNNFYMWMIKAAPWFWRWIYYGWLGIPGAHFFKDHILPLKFKHTRQFVLDHKPDLVVTTHPVATCSVNYLKNKGLYNGPLLTTFSDYHTQPFHVYKNVNKYLLVIPEQVEDLRKLGSPAETVVPGMLLDEKYYNLPSKEEARRQLNLPLDKKIVLVMGGGRGWEMEETIKAVGKLQANTFTILVAGSDERKAEVEAQAAQYKLPADNYQVTGFIEPSLYFAAADVLVSKPGGLTSSQAFLAKLPILVTSALPGQEDINIKYLTAKKAIILKGPNDTLDGLLTDYLQNPQKLEEIAQNAYKLAPVNAPKIALEAINQALYSKE